MPILQKNATLRRQVVSSIRFLAGLFVHDTTQSEIAVTFWPNPREAWPRWRRFGATLRLPTLPGTGYRLDRVDR